VTVNLFLAQSRRMTSDDDNLLSALGFLRIALLVLALINLLLPLIDVLLPAATSSGAHTLWSVLTTIITPVLAPLLGIVILFDYIMSRIRAADAATDVAADVDGALRKRYVTIGRIELTVLGITLLFWVPFFTLKFS
jgi:hypothetical protein